MPRFVERLGALFLLRFFLLPLLWWLPSGCARKLPTADQKVTTPQLAVQALGKPASLYYNPGVLDYLRSHAPGLLTIGDLDWRSERSQNFQRAAKDPERWRQLDRQWHFDAVLLSGDPAAFREVAEHLRTSSDWALSYVDHTSIIFRRAPAAVWQPETALGPLLGQFDDRPVVERVAVRVGLAGKLILLGEVSLAKVQLEAAAALDPKSPALWTQYAVYHASRKAYPDALQAADRALALEPGCPGALTIKAQVLLESGEKEKAFEVSCELVRKEPADPPSLFLHARIAHEIHDYHTEIDSLKMLIKHATKARQPLAGYRLYLAQAYTASGQAAPAVAEFEHALKEPDITPEQKQFAKESVRRIKSRVPL